MKALRSAISHAMAPWVLKGRFRVEDARIITSSPRSGSTLFAQLFGMAKGSCVLFEPLHLDEVPEAKAAGFDWQTYRDPDQTWVEGEQFFSRLWEGRIVNRWMLRESGPLGEMLEADTLIVKFVRATRLLPWLCNQFPVRPPIHLLRHPCGVIASQLHRSWVNPGNLTTPEYLEPFPAFRDLLQGLETDVEKLAASWALDQLPCLLSRTPHPWRCFTYEEILLHTERTISEIVEAWDLDVDITLVAQTMETPSSVVGASGIQGLDGWKGKLSSREVQQIMRVINGFGLDFYDLEGQVDSDRLRDAGLAEQIRRMGKDG
ncbi:MAG: hypothetical protein AAF933_07445 [Pseudomonadota bacterium]